MQAPPDKPKHICICAMITEKEIRDAAANGEHITAFSRRTGATTACGACYVDVYTIFQDSKRERDGQSLLPFGPL